MSGLLHAMLAAAMDVLATPRFQLRAAGHPR
eukprot:CAMPEP_0117585518 /NCGR_PEP_ID=MMETSP0784-20121206/68194_1 /TAXON_ID=39447 /ORGANISM="" /LENGTH=30 /DNA_ID= /DNA_START= /DNA_END= /DNA_ORIENTATION=